MPSSVVWIRRGSVKRRATAPSVPTASSTPRQRLRDVGGPVSGGQPDDGRVGDDVRASPGR